MLAGARTLPSQRLLPYFPWSRAQSFIERHYDKDNLVQLTESEWDKTWFLVPSKRPGELEGHH